MREMFITPADREAVRLEQMEKFKNYGLLPQCVGCENEKICPQANVNGLTLVICPMNLGQNKELALAIEIEAQMEMERRRGKQGFWGVS